MPIIRYIAENFPRYALLLGEHLLLTLCAFFVAAAVCVALGVFCAYRQTFAIPVLGFFDVLRVIPSLALLLLLLPILGTGFWPAFCALMAIGAPAILSGTCLGFRDVEARVLEAGRSVGMRERDLFFRVSVPLALPNVLNGCRISLVCITAGAPLASFIGAGGLGELIIAGISQNRVDQLMAGAVSTTAIALLWDGLFFLLRARVTRYRNPRAAK